jgi:hypothetical protein
VDSTEQSTSTITLVRSKAGTIGRGARRLAASAVALGPSSTAGFMAEQVRERFVGRDAVTVRNSGLTWVAAGDGLDTTVRVHHYWADAYGIEPELTAELLDPQGRTVAAWDVELAPHGALDLDVRAICAEHGVPLPFEGQLLLTASHPDLVEGRPVQVFGEYRGRVGSTGVHGQYGLQRRPAAQWISGMLVDAEPGAVTSVVVTNAYDGPGAGGRARSVVRLYDADGVCRTAGLPRLAPRESRRVRLDELFDDVAGFLAGRTGHLIVSVPCPSSRLLVLTEYPDGRVIANHGTIDRVFDQAPGVLAPAAGLPPHPVASLPVRCDAERETVVTLPNRWGPRPSWCTAVIDVFDLDGSLVGSIRELVPTNGVRVVRIGERLAGGGPRPDLRGHAELRVLPDRALAEWPAVIDVIVGFEEHGRLAGDVQVGSDFFNVVDTTGVPGPLVRRTRVTAPVRTADGVRSWLFLSHPVAAGDAPPASVRLTLVDADGQGVAVESTELPAHGALCRAVDDLFPDAAGLLGPSGRGTVHVRSTEARLYGYVWTETAGEPTFPIDHLIGG